MKRQPIDKSQRVLSIHNLNVSIMSGVGCVLAFERANFDHFQTWAADDVAALSTQHPVRSAMFLAALGKVSYIFGKVF